MIKTLTSKFNSIRSASTNFAVDITNGKNFGESLRIIEESGIFDLDFYAGQTIEPNLKLSSAIAHYLNSGARNKLDPHPLFDTAFYIQTNEDVNFNSNNPFVHFLTIGWSEGRNPHPLFDVQFYLNRYEDVRRDKVNPLVHYIHFGAAEKREPSPIFNRELYKKKIQEADLSSFFIKHHASGGIISFAPRRKFRNTKVLRVSPFRAYLGARLGAGKRISFLRRFKTATASKKMTLLPAVNENLLIHFLTEGARRYILPFPNFELLYRIEPRIRSNNPNSAIADKAAKFWRVILRDLSTDQTVPKRFSSFVRHLAKAKLNKEKYLLLKNLMHSLTFKKDANEFMQNERSIILVSHQASYTGAPLLLLHLARELSARGWECLLLLDRGGELENEFSEVAHVIDFQGWPSRYKLCKQYLSLLFDDLRFKKPKICLLNSLETGKYAKPIDECGIEIISLVHEIVDTYSSVFLEDVFERSKAVIFPAKFVRNFAQNKLGQLFKCSRELIIPNALFEENFGAYSREEGRQRIRQEINAPENALVVLGCGSPDMRKGIDLFVTVAKILIIEQKKNPEKFFGRPLHFVWIGADKIDHFTAHYYVNWDLDQGNLKNNIHFLASRKDLRPTFRGADIFVLPSRKDPFPCVVHNAMAAELPIVTFENAGGVPEMVEGGGAQIVPYGDILGFVRAVEDYLLSEDKRVVAGKLNARLVAERFGFADYVTKLENEIQSIAKK